MDRRQLIRHRQLALTGHGPLWITATKDPLQGESPVLDELVVQILRVQPDGGRFWVRPDGVFLLASGRWLVRF